uniref:Uncharacterized protein LOC108038788 n=1 Tax=Drosophila rhopaloa TaxID=1041015 RepID=A0A6P4E3U7_DRORH
MKPETLNNLSRNARESLDGSTTENNSLSSDSDIEDLSCGTSDQRSIVQGLRKTIKRNKTKINDLVAKLTIAEMHLASEKEKAIYRDDLIKALKMSTDLANQTKDLSIKQMQNKINELENVLDLSKSRSLVEDIDKDTSGMIEPINQYKKIIDDLNFEILKSESKLQEKADKLVDLEEKAEKYENIISEKEEHISRLESKIENDQAKIKEMYEKLSKFTLDAESCQNPSEPQVFLNCTKIPSIKMITLSGWAPFAAVFEDIPGAGPGWMVIQRRIDGSFDTNIKECFNSGCGIYLANSGLEMKNCTI